MANAGHLNPATAQVAIIGPKPATPAQTEAKRDLTSWWKTFKRSGLKVPEHTHVATGIFGVPLQQSIRYANVAISLFNDEGQSYIYGYVPIVVAKCGVFLKEKATDVEGIFRMSGAEKRIKELRVAFDSPDRYGKGLDWTGYTVHDAANILRRYFNQLPEPIIPLEFYEHFRAPLRNHQAQAVGAMESQGPVSGEFDAEQAIRDYQALITELPPLNRQLLLYILDLLAVFQSKSDLNKMTTPNLAAIFQPGLLSHPQHDMAPKEYRLSQDVLIFLIENQDSFLIGMTGTAVDEKTVKEVQSGPTTPRAPGTPTTPSRSKTVVGRSNSVASGNAGPEAAMKWGSLRRNVSVSSKTSRRSNGGPSPAPATPVLNSPTTPSGSGVHRSNTVPSKRSAGTSPRINRDKHSDPATPSPTLPPLPNTSTTSPHPIVTSAHTPSRHSQDVTPTGPPAPLDLSPLAPPQITSASSSEATTPLAGPGSDGSSTMLVTSFPAQGAMARERSPSGTPTGQSRAFLDIFKQSPTEDGRKPNKLQKKRIPGSTLSSAQSSAHDLQPGDDNTRERSVSPNSTNRAVQVADRLNGPAYDHSAYATAQTSPLGLTPHRMPTDSTLRPTISPTHSHTSAADHTDASEADYTDGSTTGDHTEKKRRWRFSQSSKAKNAEQASRTARNSVQLGIHPTAERSKSTVASSGRKARVGSVQEGSPPTVVHPSPPPEHVTSDSEEKKKGPMSWIRGKIAEKKEKDAEKHAGTPSKNRERSDSRRTLSIAEEEGLAKSTELPRQGSLVPSERSQKQTSHGLGEMVSRQTSRVPSEMALQEEQTITTDHKLVGEGKY